MNPLVLFLALRENKATLSANKPKLEKAKKDAKRYLGCSIIENQDGTVTIKCK